MNDLTKCLDVKDQMKVCTKCGIGKELSEYFKAPRGKYGLQSVCKDCRREINKQWRIKNIDKSKAMIKKWQESHRERINFMARKKYLEQIEMRREKARNKMAKKRKTLKGKLDHCMSSAINKALHNHSKKNRHWEKLVDYTIDQLKEHLEKKFRPGMTWDNYGTFWEIDHKIPKAIFNFGRPEDIDFRLCWSLKNLQPLEASKNKSKKAKIDKPFQPSLALNWT